MINNVVISWSVMKLLEKFISTIIKYSNYHLKVKIVCTKPQLVGDLFTSQSMLSTYNIILAYKAK